MCVLPKAVGSIHDDLALKVTGETIEIILGVKKVNITKQASSMKVA